MKPRQRSRQGANKKMSERFYDLLKESIIVQSILTVMFSGTLCTMYLVPLLRGTPTGEIEIPGALLTLTGAIIGYWFKAKDRFNARNEDNRAD